MRASYPQVERGQIFPSPSPGPTLSQSLIIYPCYLCLQLLANKNVNGGSKFPIPPSPLHPYTCSRLFCCASDADLSCRRFTLYPYHLQGQNSGLELLMGIGTAILLQAFTAPNSYAQACIFPLPITHALGCRSAH